MSSFKLASLVFRTLAKPVANALKRQAKSRDAFRYVCINVAQLAHRTEMTWKMRVLGYKNERIRPLNDARAVDAGADFLGEAFIFGVAASLILAEQLRSRSQAKRQRSAIDERLDSLEALAAEQREVAEQLRDEHSLLRTEADELAAQVASLNTALERLAGQAGSAGAASHGGR
ncbi:hypothetical protein IWQ56_003500 [Coemansia nantahalensis]|uniref:Uncharacterized protein n=2 Tax=Coemansia TaxID=4863 RepID=A0ACC1KQ15_9FUNG|nr:hypothetical protein IWQ56_003500 [Coemansia nantahalensis]KAJ2774689.1 hypothetical protein IWQ57_000705 [Coemansia nantahalensis]KAJ2792940.1 hypothetical protein H4R21_006091 [Coemansia helicoidea]